MPPSAFTPKTTDQPVKDNYSWHPLYGNGTWSEVSLTAMTSPAAWVFETAGPLALGVLRLDGA